MKIGPEVSPTSAISGSNSDTIIVRGHDLARDLIGSISFTEHLWLLVKGEMPSAAQRQMLDATLVAIAEHGLVPSVVAARMTLAAAPEAFQGAVAAGLLGCGSVILGSSQTAGQFLDQIVKETEGTDLRATVETVIRRYRSERRPVPGFGHPLHKEGDPRAIKLLDIAAQLGVAGLYCRTLAMVETVLPEVTGRALMMNISGAIPAVLLDAGYPLLALKGVPLLARTASLIGHLLEEQTAPIGFLMAEKASDAIRYSGAAPAGFEQDGG